MIPGPVGRCDGAMRSSKYGAMGAVGGSSRIIGPVRPINHPDEVDQFCMAYRYWHDGLTAPSNYLSKSGKTSYEVICFEARAEPWLEPSARCKIISKGWHEKPPKVLTCPGGAKSARRAADPEHLSGVGRVSRSPGFYCKRAPAAPTRAPSLCGRTTFALKRYCDRRPDLMRGGSAVRDGLPIFRESSVVVLVVDRGLGGEGG